jgi:hypothetical protein
MYYHGMKIFCEHYFNVFNKMILIERRFNIYYFEGCVVTSIAVVPFITFI